MQSFILILSKSALLVSAALLCPSAPAVCVAWTQAAVKGFVLIKLYLTYAVCLHLQRRRYFYA